MKDWNYYDTECRDLRKLEALDGFYLYKGFCYNCSKDFILQVRKGVKVSKIIFKVKCDNCGCEVTDE